jgi:hypothetical protein
MILSDYLQLMVLKSCKLVAKYFSGYLQSEVARVLCLYINLINYCLE